MSFKYYYLLQDILGILILALGLKLMIIYTLKIIKGGATAFKLLCFTGNLFLFLSGLNLILMYPGLKSWVISLGLFIVAWLFGLIANFKAGKLQKKSVV